MTIMLIKVSMKWKFNPISFTFSVFCFHNSIFCLNNSLFRSICHKPCPFLQSTASSQSDLTTSNQQPINRTKFSFYIFLFFIQSHFCSICTSSYGRKDLSLVLFRSNRIFSSQIQPESWLMVLSNPLNSCAIQIKVKPSMHKQCTIIKYNSKTVLVNVRYLEFKFTKF